ADNATGGETRPAVSGGVEAAQSTTPGWNHPRNARGHARAQQRGGRWATPPQGGAGSKVHAARERRPTARATDDVGGRRLGPHGRATRIQSVAPPVRPREAL